jgi:hypothetical protein
MVQKRLARLEPSNPQAINDQARKSPRSDEKQRPGNNDRLPGLVEQPGTAYHVFMPKLVKRYARTRLYDTEALRYVTLADLILWVANGISFVVIDAETGEDITRVLLA